MVLIYTTASVFLSFQYIMLITFWDFASLCVLLQLNNLLYLEAISSVVIKKHFVQREHLSKCNFPFSIRDKIAPWLSKLKNGNCVCLQVMSWKDGMLEIFEIWLSVPLKCASSHFYFNFDRFVLLFHAILIYKSWMIQEDNKCIVSYQNQIAHKTKI